MTTKCASKIPISSHYFVKVLYRTEAVQDLTLQKRSRHPLFELLCLRQLNEKLASAPHQAPHDGRGDRLTIRRHEPEFWQASECAVIREVQTCNAEELRDIRRRWSALVTSPFMIPISANEVRSRVTPIPTPAVVRALGSLAVGGSVGVMVSEAPLGIKAITALVCVVVAIAVTWLHPYRKQIAAFAEEKNVSRVPSISMVVPLMVWWLVLMMGPLVHWSAVAGLLVGILAAVAAWLLYPHVDGTRRLAYA